MPDWSSSASISLSLSSASSSRSDTSSPCINSCTASKCSNGSPPFRALAYWRRIWWNLTLRCFGLLGQFRRAISLDTIRNTFALLRGLRRAACSLSWWMISRKVSTFALVHLQRLAFPELFSDTEWLAFPRSVTKSKDLVTSNRLRTLLTHS